MFVTDIRKEFYDVVVNQASKECFCSCVVAGSLFGLSDIIVFNYNANAMLYYCYYH